MTTAEAYTPGTERVRDCFIVDCIRPGSNSVLNTVELAGASWATLNLFPLGVARAVSAEKRALEPAGGEAVETDADRMNPLTKGGAS